MGQLVVHEFMSLDGVIESPSWTGEFGFTPEMGAGIADMMGSSDAILLGRTTYEMFAPAWSARTAEEDPGAPFFNDTHKYVVSSSLTDPSWGPASVLAYDAAEIRALKERSAKVYTSGSATLVRAMIADDLVDELHLFTYPIALGAGLRLFPEGHPKTKLSLLSTEHYTNGVVHLSYGPPA
ncbi:MAG TPA: dihydrofolate reductase family protein [Mycobacteriales bacterium]|jgi:dihydrofolate reductase|nr:dihydrofolate reductase family protein [Mycobacteriales bacterium]